MTYRRHFAVQYQLQSTLETAARLSGAQARSLRSSLPGVSGGRCWMTQRARCTTGTLLRVTSSGTYHRTTNTTGATPAFGLTRAPRVCSPHHHPLVRSEGVPSSPWTRLAVAVKLAKVLRLLRRPSDLASLSGAGRLGRLPQRQQHRQSAKKRKRAANGEMIRSTPKEATRRSCGGGSIFHPRCSRSFSGICTNGIHPRHSSPLSRLGFGPHLTRSRPCSSQRCRRSSTATTSFGVSSRGARRDVHPYAPWKLP